MFLKRGCTRLLQHGQIDKSAKFQFFMQIHLEDHPFDPAVFLAVFLRVIRRHRLGFAISFKSDSFRMNARLLQILLHRLCSSP